MTVAYPPARTSPSLNLLSPSGSPGRTHLIKLQQEHILGVLVHRLRLNHLINDFLQGKPNLREAVVLEERHGGWPNGGGGDGRLARNGERRTSCTTEGNRSRKGGRQEAGSARNRGWLQRAAAQHPTGGGVASRMGG